MRTIIEAKLRELEQIDSDEWAAYQAAEAKLDETAKALKIQADPLTPFRAEMNRHKDAWYSAHVKIQSLKALLTDYPAPEDVTQPIGMEAK